MSEPMMGGSTMPPVQYAEPEVSFARKQQLNKTAVELAAQIHNVAKDSREKYLLMRMVETLVNY